jgi:hypothetical protein
MYRYHPFNPFFHGWQERSLPFHFYYSSPLSLTLCTCRCGPLVTSRAAVFASPRPQAAACLLPARAAMSVSRAPSYGMLDAASPELWFAYRCPRGRACVRRPSLDGIALVLRPWRVCGGRKSMREIRVRGGRFECGRESMGRERRVRER